MTKINVEATLVPTLVEIIAEPGAKLLILNGVCIGVHAPTATEDKPIPIPNRNDVPTDVDILRACVDGPHRIYAINGRLHLHNGGPQHIRDYVGRRVRELVAANQLDIVTTAPFTNKFPGFTKG